MPDERAREKAARDRDARRLAIDAEEDPFRLEIDLRDQKGPTCVILVMQAHAAARMSQPHTREALDLKAGPCS